METEKADAYTNSELRNEQGNIYYFKKTIPFPLIIKLYDLWR